MLALAGKKDAMDGFSAKASKKPHSYQPRLVESSGIDGANKKNYCYTIATITLDSKDLY